MTEQPASQKPSPKDRSRNFDPALWRVEVGGEPLRPDEVDALIRLLAKWIAEEIRRSSGQDCGSAQGVEKQP